MLPSGRPRVIWRREQELRSAFHPSFDDGTGLGIQKYGARSGFAVAKPDVVSGHLVPAQAHNLVLSTACQQEKPDDIDLPTL